MTRRLSCMKQSFGFRDNPGTAHDMLCWLGQFGLDRAKSDPTEIVVSCTCHSSHTFWKRLPPGKEGGSGCVEDYRQRVPLMGKTT